jgi:hypothetical protein
MIGNRRRPKTVIQRVLAKRALCAIQSGKHRVEIQVLTGSIVERGAKPSRRLEA